MSNNEPISLGTKLSPLIGSGFFRPLSRPTATVYVDCAERLVDAADEGGQVAHAEARLLIREVLVRHPDVRLVGAVESRASNDFLPVSPFSVTGEPYICRPGSTRARWPGGCWNPEHRQPCVHRCESSWIGVKHPVGMKRAT